MAGLIFPLIAAGVVIFLLWRHAGLAKPAKAGVIVALIAGLGGYLAQGHPGLSGARPQAPALDPAQAEAGLAKATAGQFSSGAEAVAYAEALIRVNRTEQASRLLQAAIARQPGDGDLWAAYGTALMAHGKGLVSPAATLAFDRARQLSPGHPAPDFFKGVALVQQDRLEDARAVWQDLLDRSTPDAPWRQELSERIGAIDAALAK